MPTGESVFILGAGASAAGGAPVMKNFLDVAEGLGSQATGEEKENFQLVFRGVAALQRVYAKARIDTRNLETVFSAFEMADLVGRLPGLEADELPRLAPALRTVIARTLEESLSFTTDERDWPIAPPPYQSFVDDVLRRQGEAAVSVITFNYDLALDYAFIRHVAPEYGLQPEISNAFRIFKLHGSLNWRLCSKCGAVKACNPEEVKTGIERLSEKVWRLRTLDRNLRCPGCGTPIKDPFLVPPTLSKGEGHRSIRNVWRHAAESLARAENVFVIGYSLPLADEFFRYLFALGTIGDVRPKRFWVFDPDPNVGPRFQAFLGPTMNDRFRHFPGDFGHALSVLRVEAGNPWPLISQ